MCECVNDDNDPRKSQNRSGATTMTSDRFDSWVPIGSVIVKDDDEAS